MNDNEKYIEEFVNEIPFDAPDPKHRDALKSQLLNKFPKYRFQPTEPSVQTWRINMNSKITKLAAAAVIIVGVLIGIGVIGNGTGIALAEVLDRIMDISSFAYRLKVNVPDNFQGPAGKPRNIQMRMLVSEEYGMRMDVYDDKSGQNRLAARSYVLLKEQKMVSLLVKQKKYLRYDLSDDMWKEMEKESRNPRAIIEQFVNNPYTELGGDVIDGIEVIGYESRDVSITGEDFGRTTARLWVDIKTKLPVQVEVQGFTKDGEPAMDMVTHEFEWGVDIHPEDFNPVIPSDYEMVGDVKFTGGDEGIAEGLRFFAELTGGRYLSDLSLPTVTRELTEALKAKYGENPMDKLSKEQINRLLKIDFVMGWYRRCASNNMEPAYYGHKVTADNPDAVLMRWRGEDGRYTVIFGDLRIEDVSSEELMELESAPLSSKPNAQAAITMLTRLPELTQEMHNDIQPDGTIKFRNPQQVVNKGTEPITERRFSNSDFVQLTAMTDEQGNPVEFTAKHEGDVYRYHIIFDPPVRPGETFVYTSEGTITGLVRPVGNKKDTYRYYTTHSPGSGVPTLRIEEYLLPEGAELLSTLSKEITQSAKDGRIVLRIEKVIPAGGSLTTSFKYRLDR